MEQVIIFVFVFAEFIAQHIFLWFGASVMSLCLGRMIRMMQIVVDFNTVQAITVIQDMVIKHNNIGKGDIVEVDQSVMVPVSFFVAKGANACEGVYCMENTTPRDLLAPIYSRIVSFRRFRRNVTILKKVSLTLLFISIFIHIWALCNYFFF